MSDTVHVTRARPQQGFTLVEILIAMLIALFLLGGLLTLVAGMRTTFSTQGGLTGLQDSQRLALTLIGGVVETAGYYTSPTTITATTAFPATGVFGTAGQTIYGTGAFGAAAGTDTLTVRYLTNGADNVLDCTGNTDPASTLVNTFALTLVSTPVINGVATNIYALTCSLNGAAPVQLVSGLTNMQIRYGVKTNATAAGNSVDSYLDAAQVTAGNFWNSVNSVKVTLTFLNPVYGTNQGQTISVNVAKTIQFERVIGVMAKIGVS